MRNNRGDLAITLLVFLVIMVCLAALYSFAITNSSDKVEIKNVKYAQGVYLNVSSFEFNMAGNVESAFLETYLEFLKNERYSYINSGRKFSDAFYFDSLHIKLDENFKSLFLEKLDIEKKYKDKVEVNFVGDLFSVKFKYMEFTSNVSGYFVSHTTDINYEFNFVDQRIIGFEKLEEAKNDCDFLYDAGEVNNCFEKKFGDFDVEVSDVVAADEYFKVSLKNNKVNIVFLID